ncbi:MAG: ATP-binding protein [bacterium]
MPKSFNTAGPNKPDIHYTLEPEARLPIARELIDKQNYFVLHAPRQTGKTTLLDTLARKLTAEGRYTAVRFSIEASRPLSNNVVAANKTMIDALRSAARAFLPKTLRPPMELFETIPEPTNGMFHVLSEWANMSARPLVIFVDEIDAIEENALLSILHQLRDGYTYRPKGFPQSVALIGMRDVREYKARIRPERESLGSASPFNIKAESLTLANFTHDDVCELYHQHTEETGQLWSEEAFVRAYELTQGQPWLVNALAKQIVERDVTDRSIIITADHVETAKETLILRRDTHLDSLAERLLDTRVRWIIEPVLIGSFYGTDVYNDDLLYVADLGLVTPPPQQTRIANPIYAEVIPRALSFVMQTSLPIQQQWYILPDGKLDIVKLLSEFQGFFRKESELWLKDYKYKEAGPHLLLYAWLHRVINGGGFLHRESAIGIQRADMMIEWPATTDPAVRRWPIPPGVAVQREVMEVKLYRDKDTEPDGLKQLGSYLDKLGLPAGHLLIFDRRLKRKWDDKIFCRDDVTLPAPYEHLCATVWGF